METEKKPSDALPAPLVEKRKPSLIVSSNSDSERRVYLLDQPVLSIGHDAKNDITINTIVSAFHAQIIREGTELFFVHSHPSHDKTLNGLWYRGQHIRGDQAFRKQLVNGDIFRIEDEYGSLITLAYNDGSETATEVAPQIWPFPLNSERLTLGRTPDNVVVLNHPQVSAHHAVLEKVAEGYRIIDTNSANHVYVNGQPVKSQFLHTSDELRIGPYRIIYTGTEIREYDESSNIRVDA